MASFRYLIYSLDTAYAPPQLTNSRPWWTDPSSDLSYSLDKVVVDLLENRCFWQGGWMPVYAQDEAAAVVRASRSAIEALVRERDQAIARMHTAYELHGQCEVWRSQDAPTIAGLRAEVGQLQQQLAEARGDAEMLGRLLGEFGGSLTPEQDLLLKTALDRLRMPGGQG